MNIDLIKEAVVAWDGKFKPACDFVVIYNDGGNYAACSTPELTHEPILFTRAKFEEVAKRMGYINGFKWGVEYKTKGKKPDLPNDVIVEVKTIERDTLEGFSAICVWFWDEVCSFRIIDPRYKPELEDGPVEPEQPKSWYESGELPPVGIECEIGWSGSDSSVWYRGVVTYRSEKYTIIVYGDGRETCYSESELDEVKFRPIPTKREKTIAAADEVIRKTSSAVDDVAINALYDAGLLRLPDNKNKD